MFLWVFFLFSPLLWANIVDNFFAMQMLALAAGLLASACMRLYSPPAGHWRLSWFLLLMLLIPIALQLFSGQLRNPWRAVEMGINVAACWLVYRMAGNAAAPLLGRRSWGLIAAFSGNVAVLLALLQQFHLLPYDESALFPVWQPESANFAGMLMQQNMQSLLLALLCMPMWARGMSESRGWPWWLASLLPCAGVLVTSSRGSFLVLLLGAGLLALMSRSRWRHGLVMLMVFVLAGGLSTYWHQWQALIGHAPNLIERMSGGGVQGRLFVWDMCWQLFLTHPWLGIGAGNLMSWGTVAIPPVLAEHPQFGSAASAMVGGHAYAHNMVLQFLMEWGVVGGVAMLGFILVAVHRATGLIRPGADPIDGQVQGGVGVLMMMLHGMFSVSMMQGYFIVLLGLYCAALLHRPTVSVLSGRTSPAMLLMFVPGLLMLINWQVYVSREWRMASDFNLPESSETFVRDVGAAIDNPWTSRGALQWYIGFLVWKHDPERIVASENFIYRFWMLHEGTLSLRYLILLAHLKNDVYAERRWVTLFRAAYPEHKLSPYLKKHVDYGHAHGQVIDLDLDH